MMTVKTTRARRRGQITLRTPFWKCSVHAPRMQSGDPAVDARRGNYAWSHCRATSGLTSFSGPWSTDPESKRMTAEGELLSPVGDGDGYGVNLQIIDEFDSRLGCDGAQRVRHRSCGFWYGPFLCLQNECANSKSTETGAAVSDPPPW